MAQAGSKHGYTRRAVERLTANARFTRGGQGYKLQLLALYLADARTWLRYAATGGYSETVANSQGAVVRERHESPNACKELARACLWRAQEHRRWTVD